MSFLNKKYSGVVVPMVSPFNSDFSVDVISAEKIAEKIVNAGTIPFVLGSTGEGPSMSLTQKTALVKTVVNTVKGNVNVYVGLSANSLKTAQEEAQLFADLGAEVLVATLPFYFPINENQMLRYFETLANESPLPMVLYNMPSMVKRSIPLEVAEKLSEHPNIVGLKDSERDEDRLSKSMALWKNREDFSFLIGWAAMSAKGLINGADGIVPSTGNIYPELYDGLYKAARNGDIELAHDLQNITDRVSSFYQKDRDLSEAIPALKAMMALRGLCTPEVLPPMYRMTQNMEEEYLLNTQKELLALYL
jgi:4-hydroxy-tetrahydrodipicolinate synthase